VKTRDFGKKGISPKSGIEAIQKFLIFILQQCRFSASLPIRYPQIILEKQPLNQ